MTDHLDNLQQEMLRELAEFNETFDTKSVNIFVNNKHTEIINLAFPDSKSNEYITDYYKESPNLKHLNILQEIFDIKKEPFHAEVASAIGTFVGDEDNALLTVSYGFSDFFRQLFPQEEEYLEKTFHRHNKNVILGFEPGHVTNQTGHERTSGPKINDLFTVNNASNNSLHYKSRVKLLLKHVFETEDIRVRKINDYALSFTFVSRGHDYMFIWVKAQFTIPVILKYYKAVMDRFNDRHMICSTNVGVCKENFVKYKFFYDYFSNSITTSFGSENKNVGTFRDEPSYWFQGKIERSKANMWKALGGKRSTRRANKNRQKRTRHTRHTRRN